MKKEATIPRTPVEIFAGAYLLQSKAHRELRAAARVLSDAYEVWKKANDRFGEMLDLCDQAARRIQDDIAAQVERDHEAEKQERAEYSAGIAKIRAARLAREAAAEAAAVGEKPMVAERTERKAA